MRKCWICWNDADSKEHKFKASDLKRIYGKKMDAFYIKDELTPIKSYKERILKFPEVICTYCNVTLTRPHDDAYDVFINYCIQNFEKLATDKEIDFKDIYGQNWIESKTNLYRYFAKHAGCKIVTGSLPYDVRELAEFILGKKYSDSFILSFQIKHIFKFLAEIFEREKMEFRHLLNGSVLHFGYSDDLNFGGWLSNHWITTYWVSSNSLPDYKTIDFKKRKEPISYKNLDRYNENEFTDFKELVIHYEYLDLETFDKRLEHFESMIR